MKNFESRRERVTRWRKKSRIASRSPMFSTATRKRLKKSAILTRLLVIGASCRSGLYRAQAGRTVAGCQFERFRGARGGGLPDGDGHQHREQDGVPRDLQAEIDGFLQ